MKINCIHCGHAFSIDDSYCDYEGFLRCGTCAGLLDVRIEDGLVKAVRPGSFQAPPAPTPQTPDKETEAPHQLPTTADADSPAKAA